MPDTESRLGHRGHCGRCRMASLMVAEGGPAPPSLVEVINSPQHVQALSATKPSFQWKMREGRTAEYSMFEEHLRAVARHVGVSYEQLGVVPADMSDINALVNRNKTGVATRNAAALDTAGMGRSLLGQPHAAQPRPLALRPCHTGGSLPNGWSRPRVTTSSPRAQDRAAGVTAVSGVAYGRYN